MNRDSYDDMQEDGGGRSRKERKSGGRKKGTLPAFLIGAAILLIAVIFGWDSLPNAKAQKQNAETPVESAPETTVHAVAPVVEKVADAPVVAESPEPASPAPAAPVKSSAVYTLHAVQEGETLESIAQSTGRTVQTLVNVNRLRTTTLTPGQTLRIPPRDGRIYTVKDGDTVQSVAKSYSVSESELSDINGLSPSSVLQAGDELFIPIGLKESEISFLKPVDGEVVASFGDPTGIEGMSGVLEGVVIKAQNGWPVKAAAAGTVVNFGNNGADGYFLILSHPDGYRTEYRYLREIDHGLEIGGSVEAGDYLGLAGRTASWKEPDVYFAIMQNGIYLDPSSFIEF